MSLRASLSACLTLLVVAICARAAYGGQPASQPAPAPGELRGRCLIRFTATSTLHAFSGTAAVQDFIVTHHGGGPPRQGWWSTTIRLPVARMSTGLRLRDRAMYKMFHARQYPYIEARFSHIDAARFLDAVAARDDGERRSSNALPFTLSIAGAEQTVHPSISGWERAASTVAFAAHFDVSLQAFNLRRPGFLGMVRVGDSVSVTVQVRLVPTASPCAAEPRPGAPPLSTASTLRPQRP